MLVAFAFKSTQSRIEYIILKDLMHLTFPWTEYLTEWLTNCIIYRALTMHPTEDMDAAPHFSVAGYHTCKDCYQTV